MVHKMSLTQLPEASEDSKDGEEGATGTNQKRKPRRKRLRANRLCAGAHAPPPVWSVRTVLSQPRSARMLHGPEA